METRIHETSLCKIIPEVCDAIYSCFKGEYLKTPTSEVEWLEVARGFQERWNFPNSSRDRSISCMQEVLLMAKGG